MENNLLKYNRHWEKGFIYPYPKKRTIFQSIFSLIRKRQIIEITGLRRVGKSTIIFQIINQLVEQKVNRFRLFYFTFDEIQPPIESLLSQYAIQTGIDYKKETVYVFLDEIQKLKQFQNQIKVYYDLYPNIKFVISGSTSLFIRKKTQESLAGRTFSFTINPLSFPEYLIFKGKNHLLDKPALYEHELEKEFTIFLHSQFIESIKLKTVSEKKEYFSSIIKKIIYEDLPSIVAFNNPSLLFRIVRFIAQKPGCVINNIHLAQELGISNKTVALYLFYLEEALLIKKYYNFSKNLISSEKKLKRYYLASPSFSSSLVDFSNPGELLENYVASLLSSSYFYRDVYQHEIDFVITKAKSIIPIEIKSSKNIFPNDTKNLLLFMKKFFIQKGVIIYRGIREKKITKNGKNIDLIPYYKFDGRKISGFSTKL